MPLIGAAVNVSVSASNATPEIGEIAVAGDPRFDQRSALPGLL
jgi:hypothetical protein